MIYVLGNINNDVSRKKKEGEMPDDESIIGIGGRGATQAVAIARLKGESKRPVVKLIGHVGKDKAGERLIKKLNECGVDTEFVRQVNRATGTVTVSATPGDDGSVLFDGLNGGISKSDVDEALEHATHEDMLLCQLEPPMYIIEYALKKARELGMTTVLNPAPAKSLPDYMYYYVDVIVAGASETLVLTGINPQDKESWHAAAMKFHNLGVPNVVMTLGRRGVVLSDDAHIYAHLPARKAIIVDRSGSVDAFVGALALTYPHVGMYSFREACAFANIASSIAATRRGVADSIPTAEEVYAQYIHDLA